MENTTKKALNAFAAKKAPPVKKSNAKPRTVTTSATGKTNLGFQCTCCGEVFNTQASNFLTTKSPLFEANGGFTTICRECSAKYLEQIVKLHDGNIYIGLERMAQLFDWYYNPDIVDTLKTLSTDRRKLFSYPGRMNMTQWREKNDGYIETMSDRLTDDTILSKSDLEAHTDENNVSNRDAKKIERATELFGFGYSPEDYLFLESQYKDWITRYECNTKAQEELFKNLSVSQLMVRDTQKNGTVQDVASAMKTFQDLLGTAKLKPNQATEVSMEDQETFGVLIKKWEQDKPIDKPAERWQDVDGIRKYYNVWFLGHLAKLVGLKNDTSALYDEEIKKYTVNKPSYFDDDDGEVSLIDAYHDKAMKGLIGSDKPDDEGGE